MGQQPEHFYDRFASADNVEQFYDANASVEDQRLEAGRLEFAVTLRVIRDLICQRQDGRADLDHCLKEPLTVADIGCGPGKYAIELAKRGHLIHISDISKGCLELAQQKFRDASLTPAAALHCNVLDFIQLAKRPQLSDFAEKKFDIILLLGPLYHILDPQDRLQVLLAMIRMMKPGGFLVAAFVTRNAHLRDVAVRDPGRLLRERQFYTRYLQDGQYLRHVAGQMHHSTIPEIRALLDGVYGASKEAELVRMVGCEGFLGFHNAKHLNDLDDAEFERWVDVVMSMQDDTSLGGSDHVIAVLKKIQTEAFQPKLGVA